MGRVPSGTLARLLLLFMILGLGWSPSASAQRTAITAGEGLYPRLVRLSHSGNPANNGRMVASVTAFPGGAGTGEEQIYASDDGGATFSRIGTISDPLFSRGLCCGGLYELPRAVGALPAGTLLWAGSVGGETPAQPMQIRIYRSNDRGATWAYLSNCVTATVNRGTEDGLWEPEFTIAADGSLVCFYADETVPGFSQMIQRVTSTDGINWSAPARVLASGVANDRPGMPVVTKLPGGRYFMTFELCGPAACTVFYKTSADGLDWGAAANMGARVESEDGRWFRHTPTNSWAPVPGTPNGRIFVTGQILDGAAGIGSGNGRTMFYNDSADGSGKWKILRAPVTISSPPTSTNFCQNYSSPLLASVDGRVMFGLASDFDTIGGRQVCRVFFGRSSTMPPPMTVSGSNLSLSVGQSGTSVVTLTPGAGYAGAVRLTVNIPNFSGTASFDNDTVSFADGEPKTVNLTVRAPQTVASGPGGSGSAPVLALLGAAPFLLLSGAARGRAGLLALMGLLALAGCGGAGSGSDAGTIVTPPVPKAYAATITATDIGNPLLTTEAVVQVTVYP